MRRELVVEFTANSALRVRHLNAHTTALSLRSSIQPMAMLAELKTTDSSNKIPSFYTKEEEYDLVYITVILLAVLLDSGTAGTPPPSSLRRGALDA